MYQKEDVIKYGRLYILLLPLLVIFFTQKPFNIYFKVAIILIMFLIPSIIEFYKIQHINQFFREKNIKELRLFIPFTKHVHSDIS